MTDTTLDTIESLLETALENTADSETRYRLRTALQLLAVQREEATRLSEAAEADADLADRLSELGYLD
jgi:hypothetical protein